MNTASPQHNTAHHSQLSKALSYTSAFKVIIDSNDNVCLSKHGQGCYKPFNPCVSHRYNEGIICHTYLVSYHIISGGKPENTMVSLTAWIVEEEKVEEEVEGGCVEGGGGGGGRGGRGGA